MMKTSFVGQIVTALVVFVLLACGACKREAESRPENRTVAPTSTAPAVPAAKISVLQYVAHPLLDAVYSGFRTELGRRGYDLTNLEFENANGDATAAALLADKACKSQSALIFVLATPMAQSVKTACPPSRPILFGAITDPKSAQLVASMERPGGNLTGTSDQWPYRLQMELIAKVWGKNAHVGVPFNPAEANTQYAMEQIRTFAKEIGLTLIEVPINTVTEASQAVDTLARKVDVIYVPADNTAVAAAPGIVAAADRANKPVVAGDPGTFKAGAVVGLGVDYANLGVINARQALDILQGKPVATMPVEVANRPELYLDRIKAPRFKVNVDDVQQWYQSRTAATQ